mmetsp:Transcript_6000/g.9098  ORF Transcript_6000/g.9098 Transcript_6000/m.9098 type:complete len:128 (+) Transcript_6000:1451-1834(+)
MFEIIIFSQIFFSSNVNAVGAVAAFALDPAMADIKLLPKEVGTEDGSNLVAANEAATALALISAITQVPCPTLSQDWKQVLDNPDSKAYKNFRRNLEHLEEKIDERNLVRDGNVDFHPRYCAISISS